MAKKKVTKKVVRKKTVKKRAVGFKDANKIIQEIADADAAFQEEQRKKTEANNEAGSPLALAQEMSDANAAFQEEQRKKAEARELVRDKKLINELEDWFTKPINDLPKEKQEFLRVKNILFYALWDETTVEGRIEAAKWDDYQKDPATYEERKLDAELSEKIEEENSKVDEYERMTPKSITEIAEKNREVKKHRDNLAKLEENDNQRNNLPENNKSRKRAYAARSHLGEIAYQVSLDYFKQRKKIISKFKWLVELEKNTI